MIAYPDTSFLCALYRNQVNSPQAARHFAQMPEPLHIASPLLFEFRQSTRWQAYLHSKDPAKGFDRTTAQAALAKFHASIGERLSAQYTWTEGYRGFDVLHVATALHLGAREFLSFDTKQQTLARAEGLVLPL